MATQGSKWISGTVTFTPLDDEGRPLPELAQTGEIIEGRIEFRVPAGETTLTARFVDEGEDRESGDEDK